MRTRRIAALALTAAIGLLALAAPARADDWWADAPAPAPRIADGSGATRAPGLFTVNGEDFSPGGGVYLAVYDQMGSQLYETRWTNASAAVPVEAGPTGHEGAYVDGSDRGGTFRENFAGLCGAKAMMRALDQSTATWSNWLTVAPACHVPGTGGPF